MRMHFCGWKLGRKTLCEWMAEGPSERNEYWNGLYLGFILITWHTSETYKGR
jgi:hypothetical protein